jgi:hypothetical protein
LSMRATAFAWHIRVPLKHWKVVLGRGEGVRPTKQKKFN